jgi:adenylate cyclase
LGPLSDEEVADAVGLVRAAIETGTDDAEALAGAAFTLASFAGEHVAAGRAIERALMLNPNCAEAWTAKGWVACYQGDASVAIEAFERAIRLSPLDPRGFHIAAGCALAHMVAGQYDKAIEWADRSLSEQSRYGVALRTKIVACVQTGRMDEAKASLTQMLAIQPDLTIAEYRAAMAKNFPSRLLDLYIDGLRKAGLAEE